MGGQGNAAINVDLSRGYKSEKDTFFLVREQVDPGDERIDEVERLRRWGEMSLSLGEKTESDVREDILEEQLDESENTEETEERMLEVMEGEDW